MDQLTPFKFDLDRLADARLAAIVESSFDAIISKDLNSIITSWNAAAEKMFGYTAEEAIGSSILMLIPPHKHSDEAEIIGRIRSGQRVESFETDRVRKDGSPIHVSLTVSPIKDDTGQIVGASKIARDISAAKESERRIRLLMHEVNHRVKNQFAVILSIVRETGRQSKDQEDFERRVGERIMALAKSHDLLVTSQWSGTSLFDLVQEHLKPFGHEEQISMGGPLLTLRPNAVQYLGMAIHELGTNSSKYGALSSDVGRVDIRWQTVTNSAGLRELNLTWDEVSVPVNQEQRDDRSRRGFGSIVLQRITPQSVDGTAELQRSPGHVRWSLAAPVDAAVVQAGAEIPAPDADPVFDI